jgi:hypothetical protein
MDGIVEWEFVRNFHQIAILNHTLDQLVRMIQPKDPLAMHSSQISKYPSQSLPIPQW